MKRILTLTMSALFLLAIETPMMADDHKADHKKDDHKKEAPADKEKKDTHKDEKKH